MGERGFIRQKFELNGAQTPLILTWHPTYAFFRNPYEWGAFRIDVDRFARLLRGEIPHLGARWRITEVTAGHVKKLHEWALADPERFVTLDIESMPASYDKDGYTGKDALQCELDLVGLGNLTGGMSIDWRRSSKSVRLAAKKLLADRRVLKVWQNGPWFDERVLLRYGLVVNNAEDTRDARRSVSATSQVNLAYMTSLYTDAPPWKKGEGDDAKGLVFTKNRRKKKRYNADDCFFTAHVWKGITSEPEWNDPRVQRIYEVQKEKSRIAAEMHSNGLFVDEQQRAWMAWALQQAFEEHLARLRALTGIPDFGCNPDHMRALIFQKHAVGRLERFGRFFLPDPVNPEMYSDPKEMDTISVDEDTLILLLLDPSTPKELHAIINAYWDAYSVRKQRSTFVTSELIDKAIGPDGFLRAGWNSCGTDTYRLSCSEPNLLNIEMLLRSMYVPEKGHIFVGGDWSQIELRIRADVMHDRMLANDLAAGDVYTENAKDWFSLPAHLKRCKCEGGSCVLPDQHVKPDARQSCKIIHLAKQYAAGDRTVHRQAMKQKRDMKFALTKALSSGFNKRYSDTVKFWHEEHKRVCEQGYSESRILNRRRVYPAMPSLNETANYPIQTTAADVADLVLIELDRQLKKHVPSAKIVLQQYDANYVSCPERHGGEVSRIMQDCMQMPVVLEGQTKTYPAAMKKGYRLNECA
jgi:DNA polymerase I-like protein with 3'-5' exonuclease and polymerase domains